MIVTIDGPAGSGKSTAARKLADRLGVAYLDTGAMYRAVTLAAIRAGIDLNDADAVIPIAQSCRIRLAGGRVVLNGDDVTAEIRSVTVTAAIKHVANVPGVRAELVASQRQFAAEHAAGLVTEGRDQGSVVFPDADFKFFLNASPEVRAARRHDELTRAGKPSSLPDVRAQIDARDRSDQSRAVAPLRVPEGAVELDTSHMTIDQVVDWLADRVTGRGAGHG